MKNRQRYEYKQHWSDEYRKLIFFKKVDAILRSHFMASILDDLFVERPITTMLLKRR